MVRSLKVIGVMISFVANSTSGLSVVPSVERTRIASSWGIPYSGNSNSVDDLRNVPTSALTIGSDRDSLSMMPATLERSKTVIRGSSPAILDRPAVEKRQDRAPAKERQRTGSEAWEVRIYNDGMNTREFVARCLVQITGLSEITAYQTMMQAHQNGIAVVGRYVYEMAEMYYEALKKNGIVCDLVPVDEEK